MAAGTDTFGTHGQPLYPATGYTVKQLTASTALDLLTLQLAPSGTGDFIVTRNSAETEKFVVEDGGNIKVTGAAGDVLIKATQASAPSTDALQILNSSAASIFAIDSTGAISTTPSITIPGAAGVAGVVLNKTGTGQTTFARLRLPILSTAPASAGLTKGDMWLALATTDVLRLAVCISTATGTARYGSRITRATLGTASH